MGKTKNRVTVKGKKVELVRPGLEPQTLRLKETPRQKLGFQPETIPNNRKRNRLPKIIKGIR